MRQKLKKPDAPWMRNRKVEIQKEAITSLKELTADEKVEVPQFTVETSEGVRPIELFKKPEELTPEEKLKVFTESAERISEMSAEECLAAMQDPPNLEVSDEEVTTIKSKARATPTKKPASINRPGRRPDYSHGLIGLEPGDTITFAKNQKVQGRILDHTYGVEIAGQIFNGIVPSAQYAYKISNIQPPKRVTGLAEWIVDKTGNKISFEYKLVPPIP